MEKYLNMGIKDVIEAFPVIESILDEYDIGCGPCSVGTCLLKDIVEIHRLPSEKEHELSGRIERAIYPDRDIQVKARGERRVSTERMFKFSPKRGL